MRRKQIRIGSHLWKVEFVDKVVDGEGPALNGLTVQDERKIYIHKGLTSDQQGLILFHECLHAALFETGLDEFLDSNPALEEALVRGISNTLWPLIANGKLLK
jgi:hypothetical protein